MLHWRADESTPTGTNGCEARRLRGLLLETIQFQVRPSRAVPETPIRLVQVAALPRSIRMDSYESVGRPPTWELLKNRRLTVQFWDYFKKCRVPNVVFLNFAPRSDTY